MENFKKEIIEAIQSLYYDSEDGCQAITCELADMEINGEGVHNCFACNLAISIRTLDDIANMLNDSEDDEQKVYRLFLPQIYLISEEILSLIENSGLEYKTIVQMFPLISRLRKLMNFLKHPKVRGFFQHPQYVFIKESSKLRTWKSSTEPEIFELLSEDNYLITDNLLNNYNFSFVKCEEKLYNEQDFQDRPDLVEKYLEPTESDVDTFIVIPNYLREGQEYTNATRYKLKLGEIVYFYFCEADIKKFYSGKLSNEQLEKLKEFCVKEGIVIFLPKIPDLIFELGKMIKEVIEQYKNNPILFDSIADLALIYSKIDE
ncbi:hypothetical protein N42HA_02287 [Lactococcus lactis]|uniref:Uncharacterized protein n=1 Tax=Lactococcus lactis subsp. lactis TaxID=1360 RepID=A0A0V8EWX3_LACLL|nr:hypothetical protein [Lactococcus lactis]KSU30285.1 hypothetical protein N42_0077 [Lactococcus lactis subsp. lactis]MDU0409270.1 hypothetical protein [Lactococcus lactis]NRD17361.1 hypothetical protein [Lactococcus lactis subsp. lactis]